MIQNNWTMCELCPWVVKRSGRDPFGRTIRSYLQVVTDKERSEVLVDILTTEMTTQM